MSREWTLHAARQRGQRIDQHGHPVRAQRRGVRDVEPHFLTPLGITRKEAAERLRISYPRMNEIVNGKRTVTPDTALRLARFTDTEPEFWLNLQQAVDLWDALHSDQAIELQDIQPAHIA